MNGKNRAIRTSEMDRCRIPRSQSFPKFLLPALTADRHLLIVNCQLL